MAVLLLSAAAVLTKAQAQGDAKPAGGGGLGATNFPTAGAAEKTLPGQGMMDRLQDDVFGTHKPMDMSPPGVPDLTRRIQLPPAATPDERAREKMDAQKNWVFSGINELNSMPKPEDLLGMPELGPDGREKPRQSAMEKYYDGLGGRPSVSNQVPDIMTMLWTVKQLSGTNSLSPLIFAIPAGDPALMKSLMLLPELNPATGATAAPDDSAPPPDSVAAAAAAAAADRDLKRRQDTFRQILGTDPDAPASFGGGGTFTPSQPVAAPVFNPGYTPVSAPFTPSSLSPVTAGFTPTAAGGYHPYDAGFAAPATSAGAAGYDNSRASPLQSSRDAQPFALDPFAANFPKRKF
jgi:hypothetical protein